MKHRIKIAVDEYFYLDSFKNSPVELPDDTEIIVENITEIYQYESNGRTVCEIGYKDPKGNSKGITLPINLNELGQLIFEAEIVKD